MSYRWRDIGATNNRFEEVGWQRVESRRPGRPPQCSNTQPTKNWQDLVLNERVTGCQWRPGLRPDEKRQPPHAVILRALRRAGADDMARTEISNLFERNRSARNLQQALEIIVETGEARASRGLPGRRGGRPLEVWYAKSDRPRYAGYARKARQSG